MKKVLPVLLGVTLWVSLALAQSTTNGKAQGGGRINIACYNNDILHHSHNQFDTGGFKPLSSGFN